MSKLDQNSKQILADFAITPKCLFLSKKYEVRLMTMWKFLKSHGINFRRRKLTKGQETQLAEDYKNGMPLSELGPKYGVSGSVAGDYIRKMGIPRHYTHTKKKPNKNFFDSLTEESIWVLGWFFSDGNVCKDTNSFSISVHQNDSELLMSIGQIMKFDRIHIGYGKIKKICSLRGCDKTIHAKLIELGCVPAKSLVIRYPTYFTEDWQHWTFLRGVLEGDGHIGFKAKGNRPGFNCEIASGSRLFLDDLQKLLKAKLNVETKIKCRKNSNSCRILIEGGKEPILRFLDLLYKDGAATLCLKRKFDTYLKMKEVNLRPKDLASIGRKRQVSGYFFSPDKIVYHVTGLRPFAREMNVPHEVFFNILKPRKYRFSSRKYNWSPPTQEQIDTAISTNTLITKTY
jgi:hypothetical protein